MVGSQFTLTSQTGEEGGGDIQYLHHGLQQYGIER